MGYTSNVCRSFVFRFEFYVCVGMFVAKQHKYRGVSEDVTYCFSSNYSFSAHRTSTRCLG